MIWDNDKYFRKKYTFRVVKFRRRKSKMFTRSVTLCERRTQTLNVINFSRGSVEKMKGFEGVALFSLIFFSFLNNFIFPLYTIRHKRKGCSICNNKTMDCIHLPYRTVHSSSPIYCKGGWTDGRTDDKEDGNDGRITMITSNDVDDDDDCILEGCLSSQQ